MIGVSVSRRRDIGSAPTFLTAALTVQADPVEVITDRAPALATVTQEPLPAGWHNTGQYASNRVESDHGRLTARLRPLRGVNTHRTASVVIRGHAFSQNPRRGHYELAVDAAPGSGFGHRIRRSHAGDLIERPPTLASAWPAIEQRNSAL